jgi:hypothetical protein
MGSVQATFKATEKAFHVEGYEKMVLLELPWCQSISSVCGWQYAGGCVMIRGDGWSHQDGQPVSNTAEPTGCADY